MTRTMGGDDQQTAAKKSGVNASTVSRWLKDDHAGRKAENVIAFARAYGVSPLKALVEAGLLKPSEARMRPAADLDLTQLTNDEVLELVRTRMREEGDVGGHATATSDAMIKRLRETPTPTELSAAERQRAARRPERRSLADVQRDAQDADAHLGDQDPL